MVEQLESQKYKLNILDIYPKADYNQENFIVSSSNQDAYNALTKWSKQKTVNSYLLIIGKAKSGKTYLTRLAKYYAVLENNHTVILTRKDLLSNLDFNGKFQQYRNIIIDDLDKNISLQGNNITDKKQIEHNLFHLYNYCNQQGKQILCTTTTPIVKVDFLTPDLLSRLKLFDLKKINSVDSLLLEQLIIKLFTDLQLKIPKQIVKYLCNNLSCNYNEIYHMIHNIAYLSLKQQKNITIHFLKEIGI